MSKEQLEYEIYCVMCNDHLYEHEKEEIIGSLKAQYNEQKEEQ